MVDYVLSLTEEMPAALVQPNGSSACPCIQGVTRRHSMNRVSEPACRPFLSGSLKCMSIHCYMYIHCGLQGDGVPPTEAREFCDWLEGDAAPALHTTQFAVCALGDK